MEHIGKIDFFDSAYIFTEGKLFKRNLYIKILGMSKGKGFSLKINFNKRNPKKTISKVAKLNSSNSDFGNSFLQYFPVEKDEILVLKHNIRNCFDRLSDEEKKWWNKYGTEVFKLFDYIVEKDEIKKNIKIRSMNVSKRIKRFVFRATLILGGTFVILANNKYVGKRICFTENYKIKYVTSDKLDFDIGAYLKTENSIDIEQMVSMNSHDESVSLYKENVNLRELTSRNINIDFYKNFNLENTIYIYEKAYDFSNLSILRDIDIAKMTVEEKMLYLERFLINCAYVSDTLAPEVFVESKKYMKEATGDSVFEIGTAYAYACGATIHFRYDLIEKATTLLEFNELLSIAAHEEQHVFQWYSFYSRFRNEIDVDNGKINNYSDFIVAERDWDEKQKHEDRIVEKDSVRIETDFLYGISKPNDFFFVTINYLNNLCYFNDDTIADDIGSKILKQAYKEYLVGSFVNPFKDVARKVLDDEDIVAFSSDKKNNVHIKKMTQHIDFV